MTYSRVTEIYRNLGQKREMQFGKATSLLMGERKTALN